MLCNGLYLAFWPLCSRRLLLGFSALALVILIVVVILLELLLA